ncbi:hypothetical protein PCAR4_200196 [Paraburkholderia caribensis]|nr:hypothetical protein PCAR4_200196 [Paraburkholderia caribensis]
MRPTWRLRAGARHRRGVRREHGADRDGVGNFDGHAGNAADVRSGWAALYVNVNVRVQVDARHGLSWRER